MTLTELLEVMDKDALVVITSNDYATVAGKVENIIDDSCDYIEVEHFNNNHIAVYDPYPVGDWGIQ